MKVLKQDEILLVAGGIARSSSDDITYIVSNGDSYTLGFFYPITLGCGYIVSIDGFLWLAPYDMVPGVPYLATGGGYAFEVTLFGNGGYKYVDLLSEPSCFTLC